MLENHKEDSSKGIEPEVAEADHPMDITVVTSQETTIDGGEEECDNDDSDSHRYDGNTSDFMVNIDSDMDNASEYDIEGYILPTNSAHVLPLLRQTPAMVVVTEEQHRGTLHSHAVAFITPSSQCPISSLPSQTEQQ